MEISFVITVFNKEKELPAMIASILRMNVKIPCEYIFIDDLSTDNSTQIIKDSFQDSGKKVTIIENSENLGPSIRLNQGAKIASGKYLFLMDADDILAINALEIMFNAAEKENADFVFGFQKKTDLKADELLKVTLPMDLDYTLSTKPLNTILKGKYIRMSYLVKKDLYMKANGSDSRIFIQDESLPLRLGYHAKRMVSLSKPAIYAPKSNNHLSSRKNQQFHDRFYAYYFAFQDFVLTSDANKERIYKEVISTVWKVIKKYGNITSKISFFTLYIKTKISPRIDLVSLNKYKNIIDDLHNVRKIH